MSEFETRALAYRLIEAATWRTRLVEERLETTLEFESWLEEPGSAHAWQHVMELDGYLETWSREPELVAAREAALGFARRAVEARRRPSVLYRIRAPLAAALIVIAAGSGALYWLQRPDDYQTGFGERRTVTLADGSRVSLDSDSDVTVRYSNSARELQLLRGQARFDVAHDVGRPFSVAARDRKVIATGTSFNIDITQPKVVVTLIEGHVVVLTKGEAHLLKSVSGAGPTVRQPIELHAGQQLAALPDARATVAAANIPQVTAWISGALIFHDEPLSEVVERVNHDSETQIVIRDPKISSQRISGVFNTGDVPGFLSIVTDYLPLHAVTNEDGSVILEKK